MKKYFVIKSLKTKSYVVLSEITRNGEFLTYIASTGLSKKDASKFPYINGEEAMKFAKKYVWGRVEIELVED